MFSDNIVYRKGVYDMRKKLLAFLAVVSLLLNAIGFTPILAAIQTSFQQMETKPVTSWVNGNLGQSNSSYVEGMSSPQRLILTDLPSASEHSVTFSYQFTKGGNYAYDFLTSWDQAVASANAYGYTWNTDWKWIGVSAAPWTTHVSVPVPSDSHAGTDRLNYYESEYGDRTIDLYAPSGTIQDVNVVIDPILYGSTTSDSTIQWTVTWKGSATDVMILYAGHIAVGLEYPTTPVAWYPRLGAGGINGSPYHHSVIAATDFNPGKMDNQMSTDAIDIKSGISGYKWHDLDGDGVWDDGEPPLENWTIWVDVDKTD